MQALLLLTKLPLARCRRRAGRRQQRACGACWRRMHWSLALLHSPLCVKIAEGEQSMQVLQRTAPAASTSCLPTL